MNRSVVILGIFVAVASGGCGGGGGSDQCTSRDSTSTPCSAATRTCYVSIDGNNNNDGSAADAAHAFKTIDRALDVVPSSYTIVVGPGTYTGGISTDREGQCAQEALSFVAASSGGSVIIDARNAAGGAGIRLSNGDRSVIDGFTIINSPGSGILVKSQSDEVQIRNNIIHGNGSDGIHVQDSSGVLVFNNLVYGNNGIGIALVGEEDGSPMGSIINNTVALNVGRGVEIGRSTASSELAFVRNNIIQDNAMVTGGENIKVFDNSRPYDGDFNLVVPATYIRADIRGPNDVNEDARFNAAGVNANPNGFRLRAGSPALNEGATNLGNEFTSLIQILLSRSTTVDGAADQVPVDIGYHFLR